MDFRGTGSMLRGPNERVDRSGNLGKILIIRLCAAVWRRPPPLLTFHNWSGPETKVVFVDREEEMPMEKQYADSFFVQTYSMGILCNIRI
jgi:hypothetical protein